MQAKRILVLRNLPQGKVVDSYDITGFTGAQELQVRFDLSRDHNMQNGEGYFTVEEVENGRRCCINCLDIPV